MDAPPSAQCQDNQSITASVYSRCFMKCPVALLRTGWEKRTSEMTRGKQTHTKDEWVPSCPLHALLQHWNLCTSWPRPLSTQPTRQQLDRHCVTVWNQCVRERISSQPQRTSQLVTPSALCTSTWEKLQYRLTSGPRAERSPHRWVKAETTGWLSIRGRRETRLLIS